MFDYTIYCPNNSRIIWVKKYFRCKYYLNLQKKYSKLRQKCNMYELELG